MTGVTAAATATATDANTTGSIYRTGFSDYSYNHNAFASFFVALAFVVAIVLPK